jgi:hypothetical protein
MGCEGAFSARDGKTRRCVPPFGNAPAGEELSVRLAGLDEVRDELRHGAGNDDANPEY